MFNSTSKPAAMKREFLEFITHSINRIFGIVFQNKYVFHISGTSFCTICAEKPMDFCCLHILHVKLKIYPAAYIF